MPEFLRVILITLVCLGLLWGAVALVLRAKQGGKGTQAAAMVMMLFGWGHMRDPRNDTVAEAQDGRIRKDNESGDPPA